MKRLLISTFILFLSIGFFSSANATNVILGKLKYIITTPNGDTYYRCKNRAKICVTFEATESGTTKLTLCFDTGDVEEEVQDVQVSATYFDDDGNEYVDIVVTPLP